ncbi:MAG: hypothetical protein H7145_14220 [Akkermansiaceae bacterium]|nr:hypothetical protein [Armatimonadota bacterium]
MYRPAEMRQTKPVSPDGTDARKTPADPVGNGVGVMIRARAILLGLLLVPLHCWWVIRTEIYRTAVVGFFASFLGLALFVTFAGIPWVLAVLFFALYLLMILTITRLRADAGPMLHYGPDLNPHRMLILLRFGPRPVLSLRRVVAAGGQRMA